MSRVIEKKVLGKGAFGEAVLCEEQKSKEKFVKKKIKCRDFREVGATAKPSMYLVVNLSEVGFAVLGAGCRAIGGPGV